MTNLTIQEQEELMKLAQENGYQNFSMKKDKRKFCIYCSAFDSLFIKKIINQQFLAIIYSNTVDYKATGWSLEMQIFK